MLENQLWARPDIGWGLPPLKRGRLGCVVFQRGRRAGSMENALSAVQLLFYLLGGLGLFFTGVGVLWFVSVYRGKSE